MPKSRRYHPEISPGETSVFGMDFSYVLPRGVGLSSGTLLIYNNQDGIAAGPSTDLTAGPVSVEDRTLYATVTASIGEPPTGPDGFDYGLLWTATDTDGNVWPRTALVLCAYTS